MEKKINLYKALKAIKESFIVLNKKLSNFSLEEKTNVNEIIEIQKKISELSIGAELFDKYETFFNDYEDLKKIIKFEKDSEIIEIAISEIENYKKELPLLEKEIQKCLLPDDPLDKKNVVVELRSATGGDESSLFVVDIFSMYKKYSEIQKWNLFVNDISQNSIGITYLSFVLSGTNVYSKMKWESGVHRVQRVPETESKGRVHTSTITVSVIPEQDKTCVKINPVDLRIDVYKAGGAGGQHVNKTESAVRITHLPTNIVVACQEGKSQMLNKEKAMKVLYSKLWKYYEDQKNEKISKLVKSQIRSGERSEKIRTYNFPQNRITDHRINLTVNNLTEILNGNLNFIHQSLINDDKTQKLADFFSN